MDELDNRHSGFWRSLLRWLWTVKTPLKMLATDAENAKNQTRSEFFYDGRKFRRQCVNVIDITWGRIYFSTCENFGRKIQTQCAMAFNLSKWIPSLRDRNIEIDRAHRVYDGRKNSDRLRTLIFCVLRWHDRLQTFYWATGYTAVLFKRRIWFTFTLKGGIYFT